MRSLADTLSTLLLRLWPARRHQELLLDLGERKGWTAAERAEAVARLAAWLSEELLLTAPDLPADPDVAVEWPSLAHSLTAPVDVRPVGVGASTAALARLVGSSPKTLANSLTGGLREHRADHRWLGFLARLLTGSVRTDALSFHHRSPRAVGEELARRVGARVLDTGDALLLMSLVSLWQRRRRPGDARAARGTRLSRRQLPKPVTALEGQLLTRSQIRPLVDAAIRLAPAIGQQLVAVTLDAALTEAHFAPHSSRRTSAMPVAHAGEDWLLAIESAMARAGALLGPVDAGVVAWRVARMRAYRDRTPTPAPSDEARSHPYVALAEAIDAARIGVVPTTLFRSRDVGCCMLLPQARSLGLLEPEP